MTPQIEAAARTRRSLRGLMWVALASLLAIGMLATSSGGTLVSATAVVTSLHQTPPIASTDPAFQGDAEECAGLNLGAGQVLWHFVLVQTTAPKAGSFIHATFDGGAVDSGDVPASKKSGGVLHFNITNTATSLTGAHTNAAGRQLNLSHICQGPPTTTTTETTSTETTETTETTDTATSS